MLARCLRDVLLIATKLLDAGLETHLIPQCWAMIGF